MEELLLDRIVTDPNIMVGQPSIRGTRLTVQFILGRLGDGASIDEILEEYNGLTREDIQACLLFAKATLASTSFVPFGAEVV